MRLIARSLVGLSLLILATTPMLADTILATRSLWEYTFTDPTADPTWNTTTGGWTTGLAPFGNQVSGGYTDPDGYFAYQTYWIPAGFNGASESNLWVRKAIDLSGFDLSSAGWDLGVDNGFTLFINGVQVASDFAEEYTYRWEYSGSFGSAIQPGMNVIAVALHDHGGWTAFDMQVTANAIPEPTSLLLLGTGLGALGLATWHRKK